jgi:hypothetical protein
MDTLQEGLATLPHSAQSTKSLRAPAGYRPKDGRRLCFCVTWGATAQFSSTACPSASERLVASALPPATLSLTPLCDPSTSFEAESGYETASSHFVVKLIANYGL